MYSDQLIAIVFNDESITCVFYDNVNFRQSSETYSFDDKRCYIWLAVINSQPNNVRVENRKVIVEVQRPSDIRYVRVAAKFTQAA